jgi:hypothetical protein
MQPDLERLLRESCDALPEPDPASIRQAVREALARVERAARRRRLPLVAGVAAAGLLLATLAAVAAERPWADRTPAAVAPPAVQSAVCPRYTSTVILHFGPTGPVYPGQTRPSGRDRYASVQTEGVMRRGGRLTYLLATAVKREIDAVCTPARLRPNPIVGRLGPRYVHRLASDGVGWFVGPHGDKLIGAGFTCMFPGRIVVHSSPLRDGRGRVVGNRFSVRIERTNELLAVAELRAAGATWFRVSRRCTDRSVP